VESAGKSGLGYGYGQSKAAGKGAPASGSVAASDNEASDEEAKAAKMDRAETALRRKAAAAAAAAVKAGSSDDEDKSSSPANGRSGKSRRPRSTGPRAAGAKKRRSTAPSKDSSSASSFSSASSSSDQKGAKRRTKDKKAKKEKKERPEIKTKKEGASKVFDARLMWRQQQMMMQQQWVCAMMAQQMHMQHQEEFMKSRRPGQDGLRTRSGAPHEGRGSVAAADPSVDGASGGQEGRKRLRQSRWDPPAKGVVVSPPAREPPTTAGLVRGSIPPPQLGRLATALAIKRRAAGGPLANVGMEPARIGEGGSWEEPRSKTGLKLLGECGSAAESSRLQYVFADESRRSFAGLLPGLLPKEVCETWFSTVNCGTSWIQPRGPFGPIPRKTAWFVASGCSCAYRYGGLEVPACEYPPWMLELMRMVMPVCGLIEPPEMPNSCNLNLYEDGSMSVGWHSDDEALFQGKFQDCRIISLTFGARRRFELRLNWPEEGEQSLVQLSLGNGDLCTMEGMMQKHLQHRVAKEAYVHGPRINLTWRWIKKHTPHCPASRARLG